MNPPIQVPNDDDAPQVRMELRIVRRLAHMGEHGADILHTICEAEDALRAPGATVVHGQHVPSVPA